ncbi:hypothetical protein AWN76_008900 [Rhodothermaceae bacterium RA]|nr:hypothetical protein AWN76_008900 [Rhodothermaceae bacterium RA]
MLLKTLLIVALLYMAFRAVRNMLYAVAHDPQRPLASAPSDPTPAPPPPRRRPVRPRRTEPDIEDARWEDL